VPLAEELACRLSRWGEGDPKAIAEAIRENMGVLNSLHLRTIDTLSKNDELQIRTLLWTFIKKTADRRNAVAFDQIPVSAAKMLHVLAPNLLSPWDDKGSYHYRCDRDAFVYVNFCWIVQHLAAAVPPGSIR